MDIICVLSIIIYYIGELDSLDVSIMVNELKQVGLNTHYRV
jgi:hypothetical protein